MYEIVRLNERCDRGEWVTTPNGNVAVVVFRLGNFHLVRWVWMEPTAFA